MVREFGNSLRRRSLNASQQHSMKLSRKIGLHLILKVRH